MCKRRQVETGARETEGGYEGRTIRLTQHDGTMTYHRHAAQHFPWWTLWLIWPLIGLVKWLVPTMLGMIGMIAEIGVALVPVLLIALGVWLLWRK